MKRFKKSIIAGAVIVGLTALTACGGNNSSSTDVDNWEEWEGKITVWDGPRWEDESENKFHWMEEKVAEFEEKYPGVEVELVQQPWAELGDSLSVAIAGKNWPDIAPIDISGGTISLNHIEDGVIESTDDLFTEEEWADFLPNAVEAYEHDGHIYGVPTSISVQTLLLNLDIFEEKGVEPPVDGRWTYDEFVEKMEALTGDGVYGFSTYIMPGYYEAWPFLFMDGGYPLNEDLTEYTFDSPEAISGLQKLLDLKFEYEAAPVEMGSNDVGGTFQAFANLAQRTVAVQPWATWAINSIQTEEYEMNFMVAEYPTGDTGEPVTIGGVGGYVMFNQGEDEAKKKMVGEFLKHVSSTDEQYVTAQNYGTFPARISAADMDPFADNPGMAAAQELTEQVVPVPRHPDWARIDEVIQGQLQLAANGEKTAQQALEDARSQVESIMD
ncbi:sugar ABC transporter substrate-binding protein [Alkalihalobacillus pseudalcaliphilus]|uniref:sugar ABC transporter substrate-binding protein n=1 Tax=Alkalihalobacillus pseudalcaliphilus TaxID=79884 RepID=UPI00064DF279|nr:extracellular solute-binding protein [Alkalihalobacillus pseudalcaliphilus]KMK75100.1 ABC transporter substrate-binding protein [Alkalihalobacillus pseudalcaliphilus]